MTASKYSFEFRSEEVVFLNIACYFRGMQYTSERSFLLHLVLEERTGRQTSVGYEEISDCAVRRQQEHVEIIQVF